MVEQRRKRNVLVTGAYGLIGNLVYARLAAQPEYYDVYGMVRGMQPSERVSKTSFCAIPAGKLRLADLTDFSAVRRAVAEMDVVVHMAADPNGRAGWESVCSNNIVGTHHLFEASRLAGVKRLIYASTNQVVFGYRKDEPYASLFAGRFDDLPAEMIRPIDHTQPARPLNEYACSKVYGEALAHMYAYAHGLSCICLCIGWVTSDDQIPHPNARMLWCSQRDIVQLVERCIYAPDSLRFDVFFAQSDNLYNLVDISHARDVLGYTPEDRAEDHVWEAAPAPLSPERPRAPGTE
ncbi:MAG TPA: NAD(P)-dependent oxidoreductase [Chloroflexota bacterium]|jgi:nucleoside-diphosphate-sugar epimerase|nr:NAD(P)-dependent oxidoreductase [Chloroflexota bacterium]